MTTGCGSKPWMKLEWLRWCSPATLISGKRFNIPAQTMVSYISARRLPTQRWTPKPNDMWWRGRSRSMS
jgi:hypothetical protein